MLSIRLQCWLFSLPLVLPGFIKQQSGNSVNHGFAEKKYAGGSIGMGFAKPHFADNKRIYFYRSFPMDALPSEILPADSIVIRKGLHHYEITYAPPWFFPEVMKLDYDLLYLRVLTVSQNWMEVEVNRQTGQTYWIANTDAAFDDWPTLLLHVYGVELNDPEENPVRHKPLDHAGIIATTPSRFTLRPLAIRGDWIMVSTLGLADRIVPAGWIRWRKDDRLLITYSLLS